MPGLSALAQLRDLLPLVDRLLPLITRAAGKAAHAEAVGLSQQLEQLQAESRGLSATTADQHTRLAAIERSVEQLTAELREAEERRQNEHRKLVRLVVEQRRIAVAMLAGVVVVALITAILLVILIVRGGHGA